MGWLAHGIKHLGVFELICEESGRVFHVKQPETDAYGNSIEWDRPYQYDGIHFYPIKQRHLTSQEVRDVFGEVARAV